MWGKIRHLSIYFPNTDYIITTNTNYKSFKTELCNVLTPYPLKYE